MIEQAVHVDTDLEEDNDDFYLAVHGMTEAEYYETVRSCSQPFPTEEELSQRFNNAEMPETKSAVERAYGEEFALVSRGEKPVCYGFYNSHTEAADDMESFGDDCQIMTYKDFQARERFYYLSQPLEKITREEYEEKRTMLTPIELHTDGESESFIFAELVHGNFAEQYIKFAKDSFYRKLVDRCDSRTWVNHKINPTPAQTRAGAILDSMRVVGGMMAFIALMCLPVFAWAIFTPKGL